MLSIGKLAAGPGAGRYYVEQVAQGREDYYAGEGEAPGRWVGRGADLLGLRGGVTEGSIGWLLGGRDPGTGALLRRPLASGAVAGFDLTFRAPKSVSILFGIADPDPASRAFATREEGRSLWCSSRVGAKIIAVSTSRVHGSATSWRRRRTDVARPA